MAAQAVTALHILQIRAVLSFPWFVSFLAVSILRSIVLLQLRLDTPEYLYIWAPSQVVISALHWMLGFESYRQATRQYPRLGTLGIWLYSIGTAIALFVSLIPVKHEWTTLDVVKADAVRAVFIARRVIASAVPIFLAIAMLVFWQIRVPEPPNYVRHRILLVAYFAGITAQQSVINTWWRDTAAANLWFLTFALGLYTAWCFVLTRAGEEAPRRPGAEQAEEAERAASEILAFVRRARPGQ